MHRDVIPFPSAVAPQDRRGGQSQIPAIQTDNGPVILKLSPKPRRLSRSVFDRLFPWLMTRVPGPFIYPLCLNLGRVLAPILNRRARLWPMSRDGRSLVLGHCLRTADQLCRKFDIPFELDGMEHVAEAYRQYQRLFLCSIHLPLNGCVHRAMLPLGLPTCVISRGHSALRYVYGVPDATQPLSLPPGPSLYFQVRAALAENRVVIVHLDRWYRERTIGLTSAPIEFAARTGTPVILHASTLLPCGKVRIAFSDPISGEAALDLSRFLDSFVQFLHPFVGQDFRFCWEDRRAARRAA